MRRQFGGESVHKVDAKGRVSIPASFRRVLVEGDPDCQEGGNPSFVLVYGCSDQGMLECYTIEQAAEIAETIRRMPRSSPHRKRAQRRYQTKSLTLQVDENGRLVLPAMVREKIDLKNSAVFAGMGDNFEIWSPERYEADDLEISGAFEGDAGEENLEAMLAEMDRWSMGQVQ